jgi:hypothetical protein
MVRRVPDTGKIAHLTGWKPTGTLNDILDDVVLESTSERSRSGTPGE